MKWELTTLLIKIAGLLSACGGPMLVMDRLKGRFGTMEAFLIGFLPIGLMIMGAFHLDSNAGDRWGRRMVELGLVGTYVMVGMQLYGVWLIAHGLRSPALPLYCVGIAVGLLSALAYQWIVARMIARDRAIAAIRDPYDHQPIEPS